MAAFSSWFPGVLWLAFARLCGGLAVVGYAPDYRFNDLDWSKVVAHTSHIVLFSLTPTEQGLEGAKFMKQLLQTQSPLSKALERRGADAPKVLISIGGAGRSQHLPAVLGSKKNRKRFVKSVLQLLQDLPQVSGVDFDWQVPTSSEDWQNLGNVVQQLRAVLGTRGAERPIITMTFHALAGTMRTIASIRSKAGETSFVDLFDMCHGMTYTMLDPAGRHSSEIIDRDTVQAWSKAGLPLAKLTLGVPFFGVKSGADPLTFAELVAKEPQLMQDPALDRTKDGYFLVNGAQLAEKARFAEQEGLAGIMIWEVGQDVIEERGSLLWHVWHAAQRAGDKGILHRLFGDLVTEDRIFGVLTFLMGGYYLAKTMALAARSSARKGEGQKAETSDDAPGAEEKKES